ncbi:unnamed protein product [Rotaria magnacalcarata]
MINFGLRLHVLQLPIRSLKASSNPTSWCRYRQQTRAWKNVEQTEVGLFNSLKTAHRLRANGYWFYREGVTLSLRPAEIKGSWIDINLYEIKVQIDKRLQQGLRATKQRTDMTQEEYFRMNDFQDELCFK